MPKLVCKALCTKRCAGSLIAPAPCGVMDSTVVLGPPGPIWRQVKWDAPRNTEPQFVAPSAKCARRCAVCRAQGAKGGCVFHRCPRAARPDLENVWGLDSLKAKRKNMPPKKIKPRAGQTWPQQKERHIGPSICCGHQSRGLASTYRKCLCADASPRELDMSYQEAVKPLVQAPLQSQQYASNLIFELRDLAHAFNSSTSLHSLSSRIG